MTILTRDSYGAIDLETIPARTRRAIENLVNLAAQADHIDEHGAWEFGADWGEYDAKASVWTAQGDKYLPAGWSLNWDCYGHGRDCHSRGFLALIQIRQCTRDKRGWHMKIRKNYFLLGRNEDGSAFAHPVGPHAIHAAVRKGKNPIRAAQDWIFQASYEQVKRQGDVGLIEKRPPKAAVVFSGMTVLIMGSHRLVADKFRYHNDKIWALNPRMHHMRGVHPAVSEDGWHLVLVGRRASTWSFAKPTID